MAIPDSFLKKLAAKLGVSSETYPAFAQFMNAWQPFEGGHTNNNATHNYLNTTLDMGGNDSINSVGVRAYRSEDEGVNATAATLLNGRYANLLKSFQTGDYGNVAGLGADVRTWTSGSPTGGSNFANTLDGGAPAASGQAGGSTMTQPTGSANRHYGDPELDAGYEELRQAALAARRKWVAAGAPTVGPDGGDHPLWVTLDALNREMDIFTTEFGYPKSSSNSSDPAQQEVENRIALGDFEEKTAQGAFNRWYDRYKAAQTETVNDLTHAENSNAAIAEMEDARAQSSTPGLLPRPTNAGFLVRGYEDVLDSYLGKHGIGRTPPAAESGGVGLPGTGAGMGGVAPVAPAAAAPEPGAFKPGNPWDFDPNPSPNDFTGKPHSLIGDVAQPGRQGATLANAQSEIDRRRDLGFRFLPPSTSQMGASTWLEKNVTGPVEGAVRGAGSGTKKKAQKWWQRHFAEGGTNIPGGPGWVGERGPEIMEIPGFGSKFVGQGGPEEVQIPEGANIVPLDEAFYFHQVQQAARQGPGQDEGRRMSETAARASDPQLQEKVMASIQKALAAQAAASPPYTPMLGDDWPAGSRDPWESWRPLTGVAQNAAMQQAAQPAGKGARR